MLETIKKTGRVEKEEVESRNRSAERRRVGIIRSRLFLGRVLLEEVSGDDNVSGHD